MRRYDDPVEVRKGWVSGPGHVGEGPEQFLWRGRLWQVRAVLAHWVETGSWWQSTGARAVIGSEEVEGGSGVAAPDLPAPDLLAPDLLAPDLLAPDLLAERELWRVEASRGSADSEGADSEGADSEGADGGGVFDLSFDWGDGHWQLVGCAD